MIYQYIDIYAVWRLHQPGCIPPFVIFKSFNCRSNHIYETGPNDWESIFDMIKSVDYSYFPLIDTAWCCLDVASTWVHWVHPSICLVPLSLNYSVIQMNEIEFPHKIIWFKSSTLMALWCTTIQGGAVASLERVGDASQDVVSCPTR